MVARWVEVGELGRYRFRRTPSTSDADTRSRPTKCAAVGGERGFESQANKEIMISMLYSNIFRFLDSRPKAWRNITMIQIMIEVSSQQSKS